MKRMARFILWGCIAVAVILVVRGVVSFFSNPDAETTRQLIGVVVLLVSIFFYWQASPKSRHAVPKSSGRIRKIASLFGIVSFYLMAC